MDTGSFRQQTSRWKQPAHAPLETQTRLFYKKDHSLRKWPRGLPESPEARLGNLSAVPLEILHRILDHSDLQTLTTWRSVNRYFLAVVESLPAYKFIEKYAMKAFRASLLIQSAQFIICSQFYSALRSTECDKCGNLALYIYLLTCTRVCERCVRECVDFFPLPIYNASCLFGIGKAEMLNLPHMLPWEGVATMSDRKKWRGVLVDYQSVLNAGLKRHGSEEAMRKHGLKIFPETGTVLDHEEDMFYHRWKHIVDSSLRHHPRRWLGVCSVPVVIRGRVKPAEVRYCVACRPPWTTSHPVFTKELFAEHLKSHGPIVDDKHVWPNGKPPE